MHQAYFRFYASLNDFLPPEQQQKCFSHCFRDCASIKDMIQALGVPHPEVSLLLVNGQPVDFSYLVQSGDSISVYPAFTALEIISLVQVQPPPLANSRFALDTHLGKLAAHLRLLGFDALYRNDFQDQTLAAISSHESRVLLTRDQGLLKRSIVTYGYWVRATDPEAQLLEVVRRFDLRHQIQPFQRCLRCNGLLQPIAKLAIQEQLPPQIRANHDNFRSCQTCRQLYWPGTHYQRMQQFIDRVLQQVDSKRQKQRLSQQGR